jgi:hypothetical protein
MDLPTVAIVNVGQRRGDAALGHHGVGLAQQRFADQPNLGAAGRRVNCGAQSGAAGADYEHVKLVRFVLDH